MSLSSVLSSSGLVLTRELLEGTMNNAVIIDLCSPPGSVDYRAAGTLGREVIWVRGRAGTAPKRTGYNVWQVIMRMVRERVPELSRA